MISAAYVSLLRRLGRRLSLSRKRRGTMSATRPHWPSPKTAACSISGDAVSSSSTRVGATFLPVESTISSFLRPRIDEEAIGIELAEVAGVEPAVADHFGRGGLVVPIAEHDVRAADEDLAVVGDADFDVRQRPADGAEPVRWRRGKRRSTGDASVSP